MLPFCEGSHNISFDEMMLWNKAIDALNSLLHNYFTSYEIIQSSPNTCVVTGELKLDNPRCDFHFSRTAHVEIIIHLLNLIQYQPNVKVNELWMKRSSEWHCSEDKRLCWELEAHWRGKLQEISEKNPPLEDFVTYALTWCLESSACLISRHWYAHTKNITEWPSTWKFWSHYTAGEKEYERRQRKKERKKFKRAH